MEKPPLSQLEQLQQALTAGLIDQATFDAAVSRTNPPLTGDGAIAQGENSTAVGRGGVTVTRDNHGNINTGLIIQQSMQPGASREDLRRAYLARMLSQADQLPLFAGDTSNSQIRLSSAYTALLTQRSEREDDVYQMNQFLPSRRGESGRRLSAIEVLNAEKKLVLLGGPGSGKSTFVSFVALSMAGELLGSEGPNLPSLTAPLPKESDEAKPEPQRWDHGSLLPVHVVLRDLASQLPAKDVPVNARTLWNFISIPWLGFVVYPTHRLLKRCNAVDFTRRFERNLDDYRSGQISFAELDTSVQGWINHVRYADTWGLREQIFASHAIRR